MHIWTQVFKRLICVIVYCLWAVWWGFDCDAAVSTVTGLWAEWPDLWFLAGTEIFLCEVCFLWWWPWRLLSCMMVTPCSQCVNTMCLFYFVCEYSSFITQKACTWWAILWQLYCSWQYSKMLCNSLEITFHKRCFSSPQHWDWLCGSQPYVIIIEGIVSSSRSKTCCCC